MRRWLSIACRAISSPTRWVRSVEPTTSLNIRVRTPVSNWSTAITTFSAILRGPWRRRPSVGRLVLGIFSRGGHRRHALLGPVLVEHDHVDDLPARDERDRQDHSEPAEQARDGGD